MRHIVLLLSGFCFLAALGSSFFALLPAHPTSSNSGPFLFLSVAPSLHDAGEVRQGDRITSEFELKNSSNSNLQILKPQANCSCAVSTISRNHLPPGESCLVHIETEVGGRRGLFDSSVLVPYHIEKDQSLMHVELIVKGVAVPDFIYEPNSLQLVRSTCPEAKLRLTNSRWLPDFMILDAYTNRSAIAVKGFSMTENNTWEVNIALAVTPSSNLAIDESSMLTIRTNSERQPFLRIPITISD